jgi:hypothetical protein
VHEECHVLPSQYMLLTVWIVQLRGYDILARGSGLLGCSDLIAFPSDSQLPDSHITHQQHHPRPCSAAAAPTAATLAAAGAHGGSYYSLF